MAWKRPFRKLALMVQATRNDGQPAPFTLLWRNTDRGHTVRPHAAQGLDTQPWLSGIYSRGPAALAGLGAAALGITALMVSARARKAERDNPPTGRFIDVEGVQVHYAEIGEGDPLVLLHGNGSMLQDFMASGFVKAAAKHYRVIAFDRPGYGYTERPRSTMWTPAAQARLLRSALHRIGVSNA